MPATTYLANKLLDHQLGKAAFTMPTVYVALSSTTPTTAGGNITEPSGGSYARVATSAATWNSAASGSTSNAAAITFPAATADWSAGANLTYGVLYDASTAGNVLAYGALTVAKNCLNGDTVSIAIGGLTVSLT
jgi:2-keto-4-pentenoate hydratase